MGLFLLLSAMMLIVLWWNFATVLKERSRTDVAVYLVIFGLSWAALGAGCLGFLPSLYSLVFG